MSQQKPAIAEEAAREHHEQRAGRTLIVEPSPRRKEREAAQSTVEALIFDVRDRGERALRDRSNARRIGELSLRQLEEVCRRLLKRCAAKPDGVSPLIIREVRKLGRAACLAA